jgi:gamma-glutamyltranspeptidase/glutathione hydrolase
MVSAAHPLASAAGRRMLEQGGNAVDAAVATAFALNVVEPNMSGIGGGGSMLIWDGTEEQADYVDFYAAKRAATYMGNSSDDPGGGVSLRSTAIPGTVDGLLDALERHGTLSRATVMQPAIELARDGFPVYLKLAQFIRADSVKLTRHEETAETFWPGGEPLAPGERLRQPKLARTLERIQREGRSGFYEGPIADTLVSVLNKGGNPVSAADFAGYEPQWTKGVLCGTYHGHTVLSAPPPQTGAQVIQTLHLLDAYSLAEHGLPTRSPAAFDLLTSALRLGMADRSEHITDPRWEYVPANGLVAPAYAEARRDQMSATPVPDSLGPGRPAQYAHDAPDACEAFDTYSTQTEGLAARDAPAEVVPAPPAGEASPPGETTHVSVVDADGNAASMSATLSPVFGSGVRVRGVLLNTSGYTFVTPAEARGEDRPAYRTRASTIAPTVVLDAENDVELVVGAPGGLRIPTAIAQTLAFVLDYEMDPLAAVRMPRLFPSPHSNEVQVEDRFEGSVLSGARERGYDPQALSPGYARIYLVSRQGDRWVGVSDPRHDGQPRGY